MERKTRITFNKINETRVKILLDGEEVGDIWSQLGENSLPYTANNNEDDLSMIQMCGFESSHNTGGCGRYNGCDLVAKFTAKKKICSICGHEIKK